MCNLSGCQPGEVADQLVELRALNFTQAISDGCGSCLQMRKFTFVHEGQILRMIGRNLYLPVSKKIGQLSLPGKFQYLSLASLDQDLSYHYANPNSRSAKNGDYYDAVRH